jgi:hypothetical protein
LLILRNRLPTRQEVVYVFGAVVFAVYSWSIRGFLFQLSSLILYYNSWQIIAVLFYLMAFALLESMAFTGSLALMGFFLPQKWFRVGFAYKGFLATLVIGLAMIKLQSYLYILNYELPDIGVLGWGLGITLSILVALFLLVQKVPPLQKILLDVEERLQIFIYFYVPLGIAGLLVVLLRNI